MEICYNLLMKNITDLPNKDGETITISREEYEALKAQNAELSRQVERLIEMMKLARKKQFGSSSEKTKYSALEELSLFDEPEFFSDERTPEPEVAEVQSHYRKKRSVANDSLPEDLPVEVVEHVLPADEMSCAKCKEELHAMGKEVVRKEVKIIPARVVITEHVRYAYSCRNCEKTGISVPVVKAPMPKAVISGSFASAEAVAHVMSQKFVMGIPLYRQEQEFKRNGILLSRQTISNWLLKCSADFLQSLYSELHKSLLAEPILHADETTVQVLHEAGKSAQAKSYMWLYRTGGDSNKPVVLYEYQPDRQAIRPKRFLNGFAGYLHTDGYTGYHNLPDNIIIVGCMAHVRRKFHDALQCLDEQDREDSLAFRGKQYCDKLFAIEKELTKLMPQERYEQRQERSKPVLDEFLAWLKSQRVAKKSGIGLAVHYALNQWRYLFHYLLDGRIEISNNRAERSIKPFVIGRKNFLFANTPRGATASAVMFSIIETAKENGLNPYEYLVYIFKTAPNMDMTDPLQLEKLLPWNAPAACRVMSAEN